MRAFEITILLIMILTAPTVIYAMGVVPATHDTCDAIDCKARNDIYNMASSFQLQAIPSDASLVSMGWSILVLTVEFPIYAAFWVLYFLSTIVLIRPALMSMFHVPDVLATYLQLGVWILWLAAYVQWKRGGLGLDASR